MGILVLDTMILSSFARAGRLDELQRLVEGFDCVTTQAVVDELDHAVPEHPELEQIPSLGWLRVVSGDGLQELRLFAKYARVLGSGTHNIGEATVLAWAEANGAQAFTDDETAVNAGRRGGVKVKRTLAVVALGVRRGLLTDIQAETLVGELLRAGARFPLRAGQFLAWARRNELLDA